MYKINKPSQICLFLVIISLFSIIAYVSIIHKPTNINYDSDIILIKNGDRIDSKRLKNILEENLWVCNICKGFV